MPMIDKVQEGKLMDEEELFYEEPVLARAVNCCATCKHWQGWLDNMFCGKHKIEIKPYLICDDYKRR